MKMYILTIRFLKDRFKVYLQSKVDETIVHTDKHAHVWPDFINSLSKEGFEQIENVGKGSNFLGIFDSDIELFLAKIFWSSYSFLMKNIGSSQGQKLFLGIATYVLPYWLVAIQLLRISLCYSRKRKYRHPYCISPIEIGLL